MDGGTKFIAHRRSKPTGHDNRRLCVVKNGFELWQAIFQPQRIRWRSRHRNETGTKTGPQGDHDFQSWRAEQQDTVAGIRMGCEGLGARCNQPFKLGIRQLLGHLQRIADEGIGKILRPLPTTPVKQLAESLNGGGNLCHGNPINLYVDLRYYARTTTVSIPLGGGI